MKHQSLKTQGAALSAMPLTRPRFPSESSFVMPVGWNAMLVYSWQGRGLSGLLPLVKPDNQARVRWNRFHKSKDGEAPKGLPVFLCRFYFALPGQL
jgi:hypothetical protein